MSHWSHWKHGFRRWLGRWCCALAGSLGLAILAGTEHAQEASPGGRVVVLSTYLVSLARLLVIDTPHGSVASSIAARFGDLIVRSHTPYVLVGEFASVAKNQPIAAKPLAAAQGVNADWAQRLREYWRYGSTQNMQFAMQALKAGPGLGAGSASVIAFVANLPPAIQLPLAGFYHSTRPRIEGSALALDNLPVYKSNRPPAQSNPRKTAIKTVAVTINNAVFTSGDTPWLDTLIAALEQRGLRAHAFYGPRQQQDLFYQATHRPTPAGPERIADVIINSALVFNPTERKAELVRIGVPVLQTMPALAMDAAQWAQSKDGLALSDVSFYYTPSELSGMVDATLITARSAKTSVLQPLPAQINAAADKAAAPPDEFAPTPVRGFRLIEQAPQAVAPAFVVNTPAALLAVACLLALGAWRQALRWRTPSREPAAAGSARLDTA